VYHSLVVVPQPGRRQTRNKINKVAYFASTTFFLYVLPCFLFCHFTFILFISGE
jgi:hypothetical protein